MNKSLLVLFIGLIPFMGYSQYVENVHRAITGNEVAVTDAGIYAREGTDYVLTNDISSRGSTLFLGKNVTLDLNGYTLRFADAGYGHIPNSGFEEGSTGWDFSGAPGATVENTAEVHVFMGSKLLRLRAGDVIRSSWVTLPVAGRSYFAMCGVTGHYYHDMKKYPDDEMKVSVYVEDENGNEVRCENPYGDGIRTGCPVEGKSPRLGGGFVYAHLKNLPAGKYRVRIKADTDCLVDEIDIRPAMDAGISVIENTIPLAHYDHLIRESYPPVLPAFYDFTGDYATGMPLTDLPRVTGKGTITIRNGVIEGATNGIMSWAIQSSASDVKIILENVRFVTHGISSGAADLQWADLHNCRIDADMPFLIQRHVSLCSVVIRGKNPSEVSGNAFYGGQGCLNIIGKYSQVHDNLFVNDQWVTNHYSIMGTGDSSKIFNNRFEPKQGSGIYVSRYTEVFNNYFNIQTSKPTCEYGREEYSTAAVRLGDYNAPPGSPKASIGNRIHDNKIVITARPFPDPPEYTPMCWGVYYSASGGENYVYNNDITVNNLDTASKTITAALYICGGPRYFGGEFYNNRITTNVPAAWVASMYGGASNSNLHNNTIIALPGARFATFRIGHSGCDDCVARDVTFRSNRVEGQPFLLKVTPQDHLFTVYWTLEAAVKDSKGQPVAGAVVTATNSSGKIVSRLTTDDNGVTRIELPQYKYNGKKNVHFSPYILSVGKSRVEVDLDSDKSISLQVK
jgi:hypothetical protein